MTRTPPLRRVLLVLFKVGLAVFLLLGVAVVGAQAVGVLTADPALVSGAADGLGTAMTVVAGATGLLGFAMSYVFRWESTGED
ncbi:hypothetical protein [Saccharopolyspora hordei]|uniref:Uncharacterized protein n=1 Tax=Saccharopolyspora hordei TaxID=1838 RepID=A0A853AQQ0_9PSEU|nr:hypothetical protein [Saccharopolyspora hordei]NYI85323.1 hypothetical protein [Saccharopolyspora hordei]